MKNTTKGFTLIELLVVIAIIGLLSGIVLSSLNSARNKAHIATAKQQLRQIISGTALLESDTGKTLRGCPIGSTANIERPVTHQDVDLVEAPSVSNLGDGCEWTALDIAKWNGPYIKAPIDPWGRAYQFDPDYTPYSNCASITTGALTVVVHSHGSDNSTAYDCDDIFLKLP